MSKLFASENLLSVFPNALSRDHEKAALALTVANELSNLYEDNNLLALYTRIDELDEELLDILAYDFKVDWWDENYTLEEKRATLKNSWRVHRIIGTPAAVSTAISAIYNGAQVQEWWQYNGRPYHFRLLIDSGDTLTDYEKLQRVIERLRFYKNLRSIFESINFRITKDIPTYVGFALHTSTKARMSVAGIDMHKSVWLTDEQGNILTDENGVVLIDEEG